MEIYFSHVFGTAWISASSEKYKKLWNVSVFPYFPLTIGISFSHIFGFVWIIASYEICKSPISLECLCFPIRFPYYENSFFGIVWVSLTGKIEECGICKKPKPLEYLFSHNFPILSKFTIPMFWVLGIVRISASREINKKYLTLECSVFSYFYRSIKNHFAHIFGTILLMSRLKKKVYF